jgi:hypothetical protein
VTDETGTYEKVGLGWIPKVLRGRLTPTTLWIAIGALTSGIIYVGKAQVKLDRHQESITDLQQERAQDREILYKIDTRIAVMNEKIDDIATEVGRQREWRDKIEGVAEISSRPKHKAFH